MGKPVLRLALLADAAHVNIQRWCEGLSRAGADIHVLSFRGCVSKVKQTCRLSIPQLPGKLHYIAAVPCVRRLISIIQPHVVVAYYVTGYGTLGALVGHHPLVQVTSGSDVLLAPHGPLMGCLVRFNLSRADLVTAWAPHMAEAARRLGVAEERILILPRGIPLHRFANKRCLLPSNNGCVRIISTRSLKADYNVDLLLKAMHLLHESGMTFSLTIAGDGPERKKLVALAQKLGLSHRVRFVGFIPNDQLSALLAEHDLYVSLVNSDGVAASLLEAMAVGLCPLVPDHLANRYWIEPGENGLLLNDFSPVAVAQAIRKAITDLPLRQRAWQQNLEIIRNRADLYHNSEIFVEHFRQLASDYRSRNSKGFQH
jgi:glycosyltransferase involved in cell wall biosynthesis